MFQHDETDNDITTFSKPFQYFIKINFRLVLNNQAFNRSLIRKKKFRGGGVM